MILAGISIGLTVVGMIMNFSPLSLIDLVLPILMIVGATKNKAVSG
jgi:hypothetical protein